MKAVGERLAEAGVIIEWYDWNAMRQACGAFWDAAMSDRLRIYDSPDVTVLRSALPKAYKKETDRGWYYAKHDKTSDISILWAMSMAYHAASTEGRWFTTQSTKSKEHDDQTHPTPVSYTHLTLPTIPLV